MTTSAATDADGIAGEEARPRCSLKVRGIGEHKRAVKVRRVGSSSVARTTQRRYGPRLYINRSSIPNSPLKKKQWHQCRAADAIMWPGVALMLFTLLSRPPYPLWLILLTSGAALFVFAAIRRSRAQGQKMSWIAGITGQLAYVFGLMARWLWLVLWIGIVGMMAVMLLRWLIERGL